MNKKLTMNGLSSWEILSVSHQYPSGYIAITIYQELTIDLEKD